MAIGHAGGYHPLFGKGEAAAPSALPLNLPLSRVDSAE